MRNTEIVGYRSKKGSLRAYKLLGKVNDKFNEGKQRAHLKSFGVNPVEFWVDAEKLEDAPHVSRASGCSCGEDDCCNPCRCASYCNCQGGNVYDC